MYTTEKMLSVHLTVSCGLWVKEGVGRIDLFTDVNEMQLDHLH